MEVSLEKSELIIKLIIKFHKNLNISLPNFMESWFTAAFTNDLESIQQLSEKYLNQVDE